MSNIQIWKSKSTWLARSSREKQALIAELRELVQANLHESEWEEGGPYLVDQKNDALLIWTIRASTKLAAEYESIRLTEDFELLTFVSVTDTLTAKELAKRLSR